MLFAISLGIFLWGGDALLLGAGGPTPMQSASTIKIESSSHTVGEGDFSHVTVH